MKYVPLAFLAALVGHCLYLQWRIEREQRDLIDQIKLRNALTCERCRLPPNAIMHLLTADGAVLHPEGHVFERRQVRWYRRFRLFFGWQLYLDVSRRVK